MSMPVCFSMLLQTGSQVLDVLAVLKRYGVAPLRYSLQQSSRSAVDTAQAFLYQHKPA